MKDHPLYPRQDAQALGRYYLAHVAGMTEADLYEKSDLCEQLAWRDKRIAELEEKLNRERWRADENGNYASSHFDKRLAAERRSKELETVATEAAAMLAETNHGGLSFARSESMRKALEQAKVEIPAQCSACPHPTVDPRCTCGATHYRDRPHSVHCPVAVAAPGQALAQEQAKPYCACSSPGCEVCHP